MNGTTSIAVHQLMTCKVISVSPDDSLREIRMMFDTHGFHHLLVVENRKLIGVISDRDLLRNVSPFLGHDYSERSQDVATLNRRAHQIMSRKLVTVSRETSLHDAVSLMLQSRVSCLPVVDEQMRPIGIVTWRDMLRMMAERSGAA